MAVEVKNDKNVEVKLKNVRLSFFRFAGQERKNDAGEVVGWNYSASFLIPKATDEGKAMIETVRDGMRRARDARWPPKDGTPKKFKADRMCLRDGDEEDWDGYAGMMYLSANRGVKSKDDPCPVSLVDSRKGTDGKFPRLLERDGRPYSGCYVNAIVRIYGYDGKTKNPDRINASLEAIQFLRHGDAFGARPIDADSAFDDAGDEGDAFEGAAPAKSGDDLL